MRKGSAGDPPYSEQKRLWGEERGVSWTPKNRRPEKLRDVLKECEDLLQQNRVLDVRWRTLRNIQVLLSNGSLISILVSSSCGDIEKISLDKTLTGKVPDAINKAILRDSFLLFSLKEKLKLCYIYFNKKPSLDFKKLEKMSAMEPKALVWWSGHSEEAWPWSPVTTEKDRANMAIFSLNGPKIEMLSSVRSDSEPLHASFRNYAEDKLLLGCEDGTLMLYDDHRRVTQMTKGSLIPSIIQWHPGDAVVLVCSADGDIKVYDMALAPVLIQLLAESPSPLNTLKLREYFPNPVKMNKVSWSCEAPVGNLSDNSLCCHDNLIVLFDRGPLCLLRLELGVLTNGRLGTVELVSEYIKHEQAEEAVNFLNSMNWNTEGTACFACMSIIMNYLLKLPLNCEREGLLEETLGSFYAPSRPLSDETVLHHRDMISKLSRRFFHHLLRFRRFEKAFLLAVDIGAKDLFMDIHYLAADLGNLPLAEVAKQRAIQIDNESLTSGHHYSGQEIEELGLDDSSEMANPAGTLKIVHFGAV
ncbi:WD repeat-containing and planar cell polarity effector protein fritz-like [Stylophora pistillata]|uniref:WD repeat-containing and planar cell polarity effector protein fritz-like n=1 Tax=Stylophora pistillata TaxID=50429 RepID=A0A2B4RAE9_STYPI|nr:WD repeat-containing and planar cell polarity effector protein fritz-like [Stylophora pistillata]